MSKNRTSLSAAGNPAVGGQALLEGVMMRNGDIYGIAVRMPGGRIFSKRLPWRAIGRGRWLKWPFLRGFPILIESVVNGIQAMNLSAAIAGEEEFDRPWRLWLNVALAALLAIALFVAAPHLLSLVMLGLGLGGDVDGLSFHLWDGFFKCAIFIAYIWLIALVPEIRRVFEYHGAEHKTINAWEAGLLPGQSGADGMSRLHPRCGTTFLLFVICLAIIVQALAIPFLLKFWPGAGMWEKHVASVCLKLILVIPISACAYELIRISDRLNPGFWASLLQFPGLALQRLTTREPNSAQLEVAAAALLEAMDGADAPECVE